MPPPASSNRCPCSFSRLIPASVSLSPYDAMTSSNTILSPVIFSIVPLFRDIASSDLCDVVVYVYYNEPINVTGTPQLQLAQATALGSSFGTIMDFSSSFSDLTNGIMAFALPAGEDTRTSNVTNNTLGVNSDDTISLNSGTIEKMTGDRIVLEDVIAAYGDNDSEAGINLENEDGHLLEEAGGGMPADLTLELDSDASFTVS